MKIGVSCTGFCTEDPFSTLEKVSREFRHWEIFSEVEHAIQYLPKNFVDCCASSGLSFSLHSSIADTDIAALNPGMREATVSEMISEMECARRFNIDTMTVHPGLISLSVPGCRDRCVHAANESCRKLEKAAAELGMEHLCIENMPNVPVMLGSAATELAEIIDGTDLEITFDIGHANTMCQINEMISVFKDRIANIHIHDNHGARDEHLTVGDGNIDFAHIVSELGTYSRTWVIESKSFESAAESQKRLKKMFDYR